jgi:RING finger protein 113A
MNVQFKKRNINKNNNNIREKKVNDIDGDEEEDDTKILRPDNNNKKRSIGGRDDNDVDILGSSVTTVFESTKQLVSQKYSGDATYTTEIDTAIDRDARAILERNIKLQDEGVLDNEPNVYRGQSAYKSYTGKKDLSQVGANKITGTQGPLRAPSFLRASCRFDYQPDICKDYKETGFCGWGDSCKFLHDRGDYKSGWQLAKEWDEEQAKKKKKLEEAVKKLSNVNDEDGKLLEEALKDGEKEENYEIPDDEDEILPFACFICREDFNQPVVTLCGHYFCSSCAFESNKKNPKCPCCDKYTNGIFNKATKLIKKLVESGKMNEEDVGIVKVTNTKRGTWEEITD